MQNVLLVFVLLAARTLSWPSLDVTAKLDADGELHVVERHRMLFNGDWNGGERKFRIEPGQQLELVSVSRIGASGDPMPLTQAFGNPPIDQYVWDGSTLRWRARQQDDAPFRNRELTYLIEYKLRNVVAREGEIYSLKHDFAFADRVGAIANYSLAFDIDPAWTPAPGFEPRITRTALAPGQSVILDVPLQWNRDGQPRYIAGNTPVSVAEPSNTPEPPPPPPPPARLPWMISIPAFAIFLLAATLMKSRFVRSEETIGRYESEPEVSADWIEKNLLPYRAEVVGASWDRQTGQAEVAALIAIMTAEGKIENSPGKNPKLKLLVDREGLTEYERAFVDSLFISGNEIDPATLKKFYKATGFDPASSIKHSLHDASRKLVGEGAGCAGLAMTAVGVLITLFIFPMIMTGAGAGVVLAVAGTALFLITMGFVAAYNNKNGSRRLVRSLLVPLIILGALIAVLAPTVTAAAILLAITLLLLWFAFRSASWSGSVEEGRRMRHFRAAREFFVRLLATGASKIDERWIPYMLAFGLGDKLDQWFVAAPAEMIQPTARIYNGRTGSTSSASSPIMQSFQAAGGRFGGAGATGGWAQSIGSFAAAVPPPAPPRSTSSSSSGSSWSSGSRSSSSSSSGSSRSGGGGGGGW